MIVTKSKNLLQRRRVLAAAIDLAAWLAIGLTCGLGCSHAFGQQQCYTDPITGQQYCTLPKSTVADPQPASSAPIARLTVVDRETPMSAAQLPPGAMATGMSDSGTCTLIYDDHQRAIVLSCWHNFRNTSPPYRVCLGDQWREARLLDTDPDNDLAALEIAGGTGIIPVQIHDGPLPGDVCGAGYGGADEGYRFAQVCGHVTTTPWSHEGFRGFSGQVREGDSGGPVLTREGRLVGVLWGNNVEYHEVMFTCCQPLRRFLDRILPGRPGVIVPHAYTRPSPQPTRLPSTTPAARPQAPSTTTLTSAPAGSNSRPTTYAPAQPPIAKPPSVVEVPPARVENPAPAPTITAPAVPPLVVSQPSTSIAPGVAPPFEPSIYASPPPAAATGIVDHIGQAGVMKVLALLGLGTGAAGLLAIPAWALVKWGARREAKRIHNKLHPQSTGSSTANGSGTAGTDPSEETFHIAETTTGGELLERDTREAEALLQLRRREGRDPLQDAIRGGLIEDMLANLAEGSSNPQRAQFARDLQYDLLKKFNEICPTKLKATV